MWSNAVASTPTSPRSPTAPARSERSPESTAAATAAMRRSGRAISVAISTPAATASSERERADQREGAQQARLRVGDRGQGIGDVQRPDAPALGVDRRA